MEEDLKNDDDDRASILSYASDKSKKRKIDPNECDDCAVYSSELGFEKRMNKELIKQNDELREHNIFLRSLATDAQKKLQETNEKINKSYANIVAGTPKEYIKKQECARIIVKPKANWKGDILGDKSAKVLNVQKTQSVSYNLSQEIVFNNVKELNSNSAFRDSDVFVIHTNIRSARKNVTNFEAVLDTFKTKPDIIICSEAWLTECNNFTDLTGYIGYDNGSRINKADDVIMYVKNDLCYNVINEQYGELKVVSVELTLTDNSKIKISGVYRCHAHTAENFISDLNAVVMGNGNVLNHTVMGDVNLDIAKFDANAEEYFYNYLQKGYQSMMNSCTHPNKKVNESSCIDHIFVKSKHTAYAAIMDFDEDMAIDIEDIAISTELQNTLVDDPSSTSAEDTAEDFGQHAWFNEKFFRNVKRCSKTSVSATCVTCEKVVRGVPDVSSNFKGHLSKHHPVLHVEYQKYAVTKKLKNDVVAPKTSKRQTCEFDQQSSKVIRFEKFLTISVSMEVITPCTI
ncbi:hypothetical protein TKK_0000332 [Trichogramma kaykai]